MAMGRKKHNWRNTDVLLGTLLPNSSGITGVMLCMLCLIPGAVKELYSDSNQRVLPSSGVGSSGVPRTAHRNQRTRDERHRHGY